MKPKTILMALAGASTLAAAPAFADRGHDRGYHYGGHKHYAHPKHHKHWHSPHAHRGYYHAAPRPVVVVPPPRVVYHVPAPVYYAPPPPAYSPGPAFGAGSVSIRLHLPL